MDNGLISRQAAIDAICKACSMEGDYHKCDGYPETSTWCEELVALRALPSAQPEIIYCKDINVPANDCISRQAAIDVIIEDKIDGDSLKIITAIGGGDKAETLNMTCDRHAKMLMDLPSVQPEIIRCKDRKYITEHYDTDGNVPYWTCSEWDSGTDYDGFCHYAERSENHDD